MRDQTLGSTMAPGARRRGVALIAVLLAVVVAFILSSAFLARQSTAVAIGQNKQDHAAARHIAESAVAWAVAYMNETDGWREGLTEGLWLTDETLLDGTVTLYLYDGDDEDGDGTIDSDGDLQDDASDKVTLIAVANHHGLRHELTSVIQPVVQASLGTLLLLVGDDPMSDDDAEREALFKSWGWTVITLVDDAPTADYNVALAQADVVYFSEECVSTDVGSRLAYTNTIGILNEEIAFNDDLRITTSNWGHAPYDAITVTDTPHFITQPFGPGDLNIADNTLLTFAQGTVAAGAVELARRGGSGTGCLYIVETGSELTDGSLAAGRRVALPFGPNRFDFSALTDDGRELIKRSLSWAAGGALSDHLRARWRFDHSSGQTALDDSGERNHATLANLGSGSQWLAGVVGNGLSFSGDGLAYARALDADSLDLEHEGAIVAWIRPDALAPGMGIVHKGERTDWSDQAYSLQLTGGDRLELTFTTDAGGTATCTGSTALRVGEWTHVVGTWNSAGMRLYINGVLDASNTIQAVAGTSDGSVQIGAKLSRWLNDSDKNFPFAGTIDDARIYSRALLESEILGLYEAVAAAEGTPSLIAEYVFDEPDPLDPQRVGHWRMDEGGSGGASAGVYVTGVVSMRNQSRINSYDSGAGVYGGGNVGQDAVVFTNATGTGEFLLYASHVDGDVYVGSGADPNDVIDRQQQTTIGSSRAQMSNFSPPPFSSPVPGGGSNQTYSGGSHTIDRDQHVHDFKLVNGADVTIDGHVTLYVSGAMEVSAGGIEVPEGSSLTIHVEESFTMKNEAFLNNDTSAPDRVQIWQYGAGDRFTLDSKNTLCAQVYTKANVTIKNQSALYGSLVVEGDLAIDSPNGIRVDTRLSPAVSGAGGAWASVLAADEAQLTPGQGEAILAGQAGVHGGAYRFDGASSYVLVPHHALQTPDDGTISFWFQVDQTSGRQGLISKDASGYGDGGQFTAQVDGNQLRVSLESSLTGYGLAASGVVAGQWHHGAVTFGPKGAELYLDGVLVDADGYNGGLGPSSGGMGNTEPWVLGASTSGSGNGTHTPLSDYLQGMLDDVRIYDAQVSAKQLAAIMADGTPVPEPRAMVQDVSGYGAGLDLVIDDLSRVGWVPGGGLDIEQATRIGAADAAVLYDALTATDQVTLEVIYTPAEVSPGSASVVAGILRSTDALNVALIQDGADIQGRVRTSSTGSSGTPAVRRENGLGASLSVHLILSYDGENVRLYQDGNLVATEPRTDGLSWSLDHGFYLGAQADGALPLIGRLERVAVYDQGVNLLQAQNIFLGKPPGLPGGDGTVAFRRVWQER